VVTGLTATEAYEFRAVVKHPLITLYGEDRVVEPHPADKPSLLASTFH